MFFNYDIFTLIAVSLALDVFVSLAAFLAYKRYKHLDVNIGLYLSILAVIGAIVGSLVSRNVSNTRLLGVTSLVTAFTGIILFRKKPDKKKEFHNLKGYSRTKFWVAIILSFFVGFLGGSLGAAGGVTILLLLIFVLDFEIHRAIGTSVFVMFFIALFGAGAHIYSIGINQFQWGLLSLAVIGGVFGSLFSARLANLLKEQNLNKLVGVILFVLGIVTFLHRIVL